MKLTVSDIQRFCMHDGEGLRTTVFLKGCPLRCRWCHNPETQNRKKEVLFYKAKCINCRSCSVCEKDAVSFGDERIFDRGKCIACGLCAENCPTKALELVGEEYTADEIINAVMRDIAFYGENGGVTLSGGEPMSQGEAVINLLEQFKKRNINTAIETCGYFSEKFIPELINCVDTFLWDIKDTDDKRHKEFTGVSNKIILDNLYRTDELGGKTVLRCIIVKGVNDDEEHFNNINNIYRRLKNCRGIEFIPYHTYGGSKFEALHGFDNGKADWIPDNDFIEKLHKNNISNLL